ncbi:MAG TPA: hypothetical protein VG297_24870 [Bryobacteraceae bacterium]|nr:hypothetical protein [Bryobacteraceae bacterium]
MRKVALSAILLVAAASLVMAMPPNPGVPEIDASSMMTVSAFIGAALVMLRSRKKH